MRETELIYQSLEAIEKHYHVQIVIKDCYTIMRLRPAFTALLQRFYKHAGMYCMSRKQHPDTENACIQFGNTVMGRRMNTDMQTYLRGENLSERSRKELTARYELLREAIEVDGE